METPSLESWHARFVELDESSPWPGPVPLSVEQSALAVGREDDERRLVNIVRSHALVVLHADSGVGKSSFLSAVARPALKKYQPLRRWSVSVSWGGFRAIRIKTVSESPQHGAGQGLILINCRPKPCLEMRRYPLRLQGIGGPFHAS